MGSEMCIRDSALATSLLGSPIDEIRIGGESLDVTREDLLCRWEPSESATEDVESLQLKKGDETLDVLFAPSGPFRYTGESLETPEGSFQRGQLRREIHETLGKPRFRAKDSSEEVYWIEMPGDPAEVKILYLGDRADKFVAERGDRFKEFHRTQRERSRQTCTICALAECPGGYRCQGPRDGLTESFREKERVSNSCPYCPIPNCPGGSLKTEPVGGHPHPCPYGCVPCPNDRGGLYAKKHGTYGE